MEFGTAHSRTSQTIGSLSSPDPMGTFHYIMIGLPCQRQENSRLRRLIYGVYPRL